MTVRPTRPIYPRVRRVEQSRELDRGTWADTTVVLFTYDTVGAGIIQTELIDFGLVYDGPPFFAYGVENIEGQTLVSGDFPEITAGVREWYTSELGEEDRVVPLYRGAYLWISIASKTSYRLRFRLSFEGTAFRNVEYLRGL